MRITCVVGPEPRREGEYPEQFMVGYAHRHVDNKVARIEYEEQNFGTYGIGWFVAYHEDGRLLGKMNAAQVVSVHYQKDE